jgi:hypothetical protein
MLICLVAPPAVKLRGCQANTFVRERHGSLKPRSWIPKNTHSAPTATHPAKHAPHYAARRCTAPPHSSGSRSAGLAPGAGGGATPLRGPVSMVTPTAAVGPLTPIAGAAAATATLAGGWYAGPP